MKAMKTNELVNVTGGYRTEHQELVASIDGGCLIFKNVLSFGGGTEVVCV